MLNWIGKILRKKGDIMQLVRRNVFLVLLLLAVMVMVPMVSAQGKNISINITSPQEGEVYHVGDAIPRYISYLRSWSDRRSLWNSKHYPLKWE
jgi:hypothetical protein